MENKETRFRLIVVILLFLCVFSIQVAIFSLPPLFSEIGKEIRLTKAEMGVIFGVAQLGAMFLSFIAGALSDKIGSRWAMGAAMLLVTVGGGLRAFVNSAPGMIAYMFVIGGGVAFAGPNIAKALGTWFPPRDLGKANGIVYSGMTIGAGVGLAAGSSFISPLFGGWRCAVVVLASFSLTIGILWILLFRDKTSDLVTKNSTHDIVGNAKKVFKVKDVWLLGIFFGIFSSGTLAVSGLLPVILEEKGVPRPGELTSIMLWAAAAGSIIGGLASDKIGRRKLLLILFALIMGPTIIALPLATGVPLVITLIISGLTGGAVITILLAIPAEHQKIGPSLAATAVGLMLMFSNAGGFVGPVAAGTLMDWSGSPWVGFAFLGLAYFVAAGVVTTTRETGAKSKQNLSSTPNVTKT